MNEGELPVPATLSVERFAAKSLADAQKWVAKRLNTLGNDCYQVLQTIAACNLEAFPAGNPPPLAQTFAGRIFGPDAEIRWVQEGPSSYQLWWLSENPALSHTRKLCCRRLKVPTNYYLLGVYDEKNNPYTKDGEGPWFAEKNLSQLIKYRFAKGATNGDRVYLEIFEYLAGEPDPQWSAQQFLDHLNQPRIIAHRIVGVGLGPKDPQPEEE